MGLWEASGDLFLVGPAGGVLNRMRPEGGLTARWAGPGQLAAAFDARQVPCDAPTEAQHNFPCLPRSWVMPPGCANTATLDVSADGQLVAVCSNSAVHLLDTTGTFLLFQLGAAACLCRTCNRTCEHDASRPLRCSTRRQLSSAGNGSHVLRGPRHRRLPLAVPALGAGRSLWLHRRFHTCCRLCRLCRRPLGCCCALRIRSRLCSSRRSVQPPVLCRVPAAPASATCAPLRWRGSPLRSPAQQGALGRLGRHAVGLPVQGALPHPV